MRILCIGDSNTWGYDPDNGLRQANRWTQVLMKLLPEDTIIEEGLNGRTYQFEDPFTADRCGIKYLPMILKTHQPVDLVIVMLGTNDLKTFFHASAKDIAKGAGGFLQIINDPELYHYPVPQTLIVSPVHIGDQVEKIEGLGSEFSIESVKQSKLLGACIEDVCKTYGAAYLNAADYAEASTTDCIHLNSENHEKLAHAIAQKIKDIKNTSN